MSEDARTGDCAAVPFHERPCGGPTICRACARERAGVHTHNLGEWAPVKVFEGRPKWVGPTDVPLVEPGTAVSSAAGGTE